MLDLESFLQVNFMYGSISVLYRLGRCENSSIINY